MDTTSPEHADAHHVIPYRMYVNVWLALVFLTLVTVGAAYTDLRHLAVFAAVLIACGKSLLVILYFMHIRFERAFFTWILVAVFGSYAVFIILTFADYSFR